VHSSFCVCLFLFHFQAVIATMKEEKKMKFF